MPITFGILLLFSFCFHFGLITAKLIKYNVLLSPDLYLRLIVTNYLQFSFIRPWRLEQLPEDYKYSSAKFYETGIDEFGLLTHYRD